MGLPMNLSLKNLLRGHFLCEAPEQAQWSTSPIPEQLLCQLDGKSWGGGAHPRCCSGGSGREEGRAGQGGVSRSPPGGSCTHTHFHVVRAAVILLVQQLKVVPPRGHEPGDRRSQGLAHRASGAPEK